MPLHLIKLCVRRGVTPDDLRAWRARRGARRRGEAPIVYTRTDTEAGGRKSSTAARSIWVFKGQILIRQQVIAIETIADGPRNRCTKSFWPIP